MRVLHSHNAPYWPATLGGSQVADRGLLELLAREGHAVRSVCTATIDDANLTSSTQRARADWLADLHAAGGEIVRTDERVEVMTLGGVDIRCVRGDLPGYLAEEIERFDPDRIVFAQYGSGDSLVRTVIDARADRAIYLAHGVMGQPFGPCTVFPSEPRAALLRRARGVLAASRYVADYFARYGGIAATPMYFPAYGAGPFPRLGTPDGAVTMVHPSWVKGTAIVRGLAESMPDVRFVVVLSYGTTPADIAALEPLPNVELRLGSRGPDQFLDGASVLLFPTLGWEAFGLVVIEALLRGVPVLASDLGGLRESAIGAARLLPVRAVELDDAVDATGRRHARVPDQDIAPWRDALRELLANRTRYDEVARDGRDRADAFVERVRVDAPGIVEAVLA